MQFHVLRQSPAARLEKKPQRLEGANEPPGLMDTLSMVSKYLNDLEGYLNDGDSMDAKKITVEKSEKELEMFKALGHKNVVVESKKHRVVVFTKAPPHAYKEMFDKLGFVRVDYGRKMVKEVRVEIYGFTFLVDFVVIGNALWTDQHTSNIYGFDESDPSKIKDVKNWEASKTPTEVCSFLGLAGYYRRFIENFSKIAKSLTILTQKSKEFRLGRSIKDRILAAQKEAVDESTMLQKGLDEMIEHRSDGAFQSESTIQTLKDMLGACILDFGGSWDVHLPLVEFSYNNRYHSTMRCAPFKALYGRKCRSPIKWVEVREGQLIGPKLVRKPLEFYVGDYVLLKVSPWKGVVRFRKKGKLAPRLPEELNGVHDTFHVSNLKKCLVDPTLQVPLD
ncbi:putative reverse transcriptase domain-containing protein [Tanacetum coccineum]